MSVSTLPQNGTIVFDFDDVFFPADNGTHAAIKQLITQSVTKDLGADSILATRDAHGHLPYFPQYVLYKYLRTGRDADGPEFVRAMENCYFGANTADPPHYRNIGPNPALYEQLARLRNEGARFVLLTSGPYNPHVRRILSQMSTAEEDIAGFFPRENIYDIGRMCALYDDVTLDDFRDPTRESLLRWLKPQRENYLAMMAMAGLTPGNNLYFEDNDVNGSKGTTAAPIPEASRRAMMEKFDLSPARLGELNGASDPWGWINLAGKPLRAGSREPALEARTLAGALASVAVASPERAPGNTVRGAAVAAGWVPDVNG